MHTCKHKTRTNFQFCVHDLLKFVVYCLIFVDCLISVERSIADISATKQQLLST